MQHTVLIADSSEDFCKELYNILRWNCNIKTCCRGKKALKLAQELHPDILVLDLMLPELDGISLLSALAVSDCRPAILATTNLISPYIVEEAQRMQIDYLMCKPCSIQAVAARIQEQLHRLDQTPENPELLRGRISELLLLLGISIKLHGFKYLREAVYLMIQDPDQSITKELYPGVAQICGCESAQVERSIRGAIQDAWSHRDPSVWLLYFQPDGHGIQSRPTNAIFISRLADGLKTARFGDRENALEFIPRSDSAGELPYR